MGLRVLNPGLSTTVQDLGRFHYREWGVPIGGAFDRKAAGLANALLGNEPVCPVLELTLLGGEYEAQVPLALAMAGAPLDISVISHDGSRRTLSGPASFPLNAGDRLQLGPMRKGARAYLAVRGGWLTPVVLGSRSSETRLRASELVPAHESAVPVRHLREAPWISSTEAPVRIIDGPDHDAGFDLSFWRDHPWRVGDQSNRMGIRLEGQGLPRIAAADRISTPVAPGAVQVAGDQLIVLGVACGTMGGYPHVAHVISADLDRLAQLRPGDMVRFEPVALDDARRLDAAARASQAELVRRIATLAADLGTRSEEY